MSIVVIGAYTRDLYMFGVRLPGVGETVNCYRYDESHGGKGANQAVAAARLGSATFFITRLGNDEAGRKALETLRTEGVDTRYVVIDDDVGTGVGFIIVDQNGNQVISTYAGASSQLTKYDILRAASDLERASVLLLQGEIDPKISLEAAKLTGEQTVVVLDPSPVEAFIGLGSLENVDILTPNEPEAQALVGQSNVDAASVAKATGVEVVIITHGEKGAEVYRGGKTKWIPAPQVPVIDTTGAGDAFNGALAAGLDRGLDLMTAVRHACRCAAFSVSRRHCIPSYPTLEDIGDLSST